MPILLQPVLQMSRCFRIMAALLALLNAELMSGAGSALGSCEQHLYAPADGRLIPHLLGRVSKTEGLVVGFEIVDRHPLVATAHQLIGFTDGAVNEMPLTQTVTGLSLIQESRIELQTSDGFQMVGKTGVAVDAIMTHSINGRLFGSGNAVWLEVLSRQGVLQFLARRADGKALAIAAIRGQFRAASWNEQGLAAVVGNTLYVWQAGSKNLVRLITDRGLATARDAVLVGNNRVVVALKNTILLVAPETVTVVASLPLSRCRFQNGTLYVLEESNGLLWSFRSLEKLGTKQGDQAYAHELLKHEDVLSAKNSIRFQEAARILGCNEATQDVKAHGKTQ